MAMVTQNSSVIQLNITDLRKIEELEHFLYVVSIVVPIVFGLITLLGVVGNTIVILVVVLDKTMRTTTNILILMLAVADLFFVVFCVPFTAVRYALDDWRFGDAWCRIVEYLTFVSYFASVYTLVLMSLDRYLAVVHPLSSRRFRNGRNTWLTVCVVWVVIGAANIPLLFQQGIVQYQYKDEVRSVCINILHYNEQFWRDVFYTCLWVFGYVLPLGAVCVMYGFVVRRLRAAAPGDMDRSEGNTQVRRRMTKLVIIVVIVFALCWFPLQASLFADEVLAAVETTPFSLGLHYFANCLAYMNSCVNPILYAFLFVNFRRSFKKVFCCK